MGGCEVECPNRCSSHGRCDKNMASNEDASYHCFCESPWTGAACDKTAHASMVVNSLVIVAIVTFVMGLCCIPLARSTGSSASSNVTKISSKETAICETKLRFSDQAIETPGKPSFFFFVFLSFRSSDEKTATKRLGETTSSIFALWTLRQ